MLIRGIINQTKELPGSVLNIIKENIIIRSAVSNMATVRDFITAIRLLKFILYLHNYII